MIEDNNLKKSVSAWLEEQGYPLEMRVASILKKEGFRVIQSEYFSDPETGDSRELDIVAYAQKQIGEVLIRVSLIIECKRSVDKPWLLFKSKESRLANPARVVQRATNTLGSIYLRELCQNEEVQKLSLFSLAENPAYGVTQALTSGKDICYSALTSVSKAARATVLKQENYYNRPVKLCSIVFPVVAVSGRLFEVFLDKNTNVVVEEIENGTLLWRNSIVGAPHTIINLVAEPNFEHFSAKMLPSINKFFELSEKKFSQILKDASTKVS